MHGAQIITIMAQGVRLEPWAVTAMLAARKLAGDVRTQLRPAVMGHLIVIEVLSWSDRPILAALTDSASGARFSLAAALGMLAKHSYGVQLVIAPSTADDVAATVEATPAQLTAQPSALLERSSVMVVVRNPGQAGEGRS